MREKKSICFGVALVGFVQTAVEDSLLHAVFWSNLTLQYISLCFYTELVYGCKSTLYFYNAETLLLKD